MNYLITGGSGFMGINLTRYLLARGHNVRTYDIAVFDYPEASQISEIHGDIRNRDLHAQCQRRSKNRPFGGVKAGHLATGCFAH